MQDLSLLWTVIVTIVGAIIGGIIRFFTYKADQEKELSQLKLENAVMKEKLSSLEYVTDHLTRAGEDMKKEFGSLNNVMTQILTELKHVAKEVQELKAKP
jgi:hypothetical protein